jgi:putative tricarboxylic transport membrane protein
LIDRIIAGVWIAACAFLFYVGWDLHAPHSYEPIGPRAYPLLLLALMALCCLPLLLKHSTQSEDADKTPILSKRQIACVFAMIVYAMVLETLGFIVATIPLAAVLGMLYGGRARLCIPMAVIVSVGLFFCFDYLLDVPLPLGWFEPLDDLLRG